MAEIEVRIDAGDIGRLRAKIDDHVLQRWLKEVVIEAQNVFQRETRRGGKGRVYKRGRRTHRASRPGDFPAVDTGRLTTGTRIAVSGFKGEVGSNVPYASFLMTGTRHMAKRKMYDDALLLALKKKPAPDGYVGWII